MKRVATVSALAIAAAAGPVAADVTPGQVWSDLQAYMAGFGYEMSATETMSGDTLTLSDITMAVPIPEEGLVAAIDMPDLSYTDNGDGTVSMGLSEDGQVIVSVSEEGGAPEAVITMGVRQVGFTALISGETDSLSYDYAVDSITLSLDEMMADGEVITRDMFSFEMSMGPVVGRSDVVRADGLQTIVQELSYGDVAYDVVFDDPESDDAGSFSGTFAALSGSGETTLPMDADFEDPSALFAAGLAVDATVTHEGGTTRFSVNDLGDLVSGEFSSEGGAISVAISNAAMTYALSAVAQKMMMVVPDMPFPVEAEIGELGFSLDMPLQPSDAPQPAGLSLLMSDFVMADMLWNIIDPGQALPRDPATISATLAAQVTPFVSILDEDALETMARSGGVPGELNSVDLTDLVVRAAGGEITGEGAFVFDNSDLESFDGLPRPEGELTLNVSGANGLIDNLIAMGLLREEDAMGARMMLSMFTVPGSAPDSASSTIAINAEGHILANGQRIQ